MIQFAHLTSPIISCWELSLYLIHLNDLDIFVYLTFNNKANPDCIITVSVFGHIATTCLFA